MQASNPGIMLGILCIVSIVSNFCYASAASSSNEVINSDFAFDLLEVDHPNAVFDLPCSEKYLTDYYYEKHNKPLVSNSDGLFSRGDGSHNVPKGISGSMFNMLGFSDLHRLLIGEGSHRHLVSTLTINNESVISRVDDHSCKAVFVERLPLGIFADPFELQHLVERQVFLDAAVFGDTNLELPSAVSNQSIVELHMDIRQTFTKIKLKLPLHARYPPLDASGYSTVELGAPEIYMLCKPKVAQRATCSWSIANLSDRSTNSVVWLVPCGKREDVMVVSSVTFISALVSALLIVLSASNCFVNYHTKNS